MNSSVANPLRCLCYPQAYLPLSYAAQIPTTRNPDLANVRLSLSNLNQEVRKCRVYFVVVVVVSVLVCTCLIKCVRVHVCVVCGVCD